MACTLWLIEGIGAKEGREEGNLYGNQV